MSAGDPTPAEEYSWPNRKDRPFKPRPPKRDQAGFLVEPTAESYFDDEMWDARYRDGYFWAAENLARDLLNSEALKREDPDREFLGVHLPMLYCYRHYLEVSLKRLIFIWAPLSQLNVRKGLDKEHGLEPLWNEAKRHGEEVFGPPDPNSETDSAVEQCIIAFHELDPTSQTFRYRRDLSGRPHEGQIPPADLQQLMRTMRGLHNYFWSCEYRAEEVAECQAQERGEAVQNCDCGGDDVYGYDDGYGCE
jgi:hypothetical protein